MSEVGQLYLRVKAGLHLECPPVTQLQWRRKPSCLVKHDYSKHTYNELKIIVIFIPCDFLHIVNLMNIMLITKLITKQNRLLLALCYSVLIYYYYCS